MLHDRKRLLVLHRVVVVREAVRWFLLGWIESIRTCMTEILVVIIGYVLLVLVLVLIHWTAVKKSWMGRGAK